MPIWKITNHGPKKLPETRLENEEMLEEHLEEWIAKDSSILGEALMIIGRQVSIPEVRDRIDLLALDPQGNAVIIELKRDRLTDPVDMQALRYASYVSKWIYEDFENQARNYLRRKDDSEFNFNEQYERFCKDEDMPEAPNINADQRVILVGSEIREKLGAVALWLREHDIDIKVVEFESFKEGDSILFQPHVIVPHPVAKFTKTGARKSADGIHPWLTDGRTWHLEKKCGPKTREILLELDGILRDNFDVEGPIWNQKYYVSYRVGNRTWIYVNTSPSALVLDMRVTTGRFSQDKLAKDLGIQVFDKSESQSGKISLPSSVRIDDDEGNEWIKLRVKEDLKLGGKEFVDFLKEAYESIPKR